MFRCLMSKPTASRPTLASSVRVRPILIPTANWKPWVTVRSLQRAQSEPEPCPTSPPVSSSPVVSSDRRSDSSSRRFSIRRTMPMIGNSRETSCERGFDRSRRGRTVLPRDRYAVRESARTGRSVSFQRRRHGAGSVFVLWEVDGMNALRGALGFGLIFVGVLLAGDPDHIFLRLSWQHQVLETVGVLAFVWSGGGCLVWGIIAREPWKDIEPRNEKITPQSDQRGSP